MNSAFAISHLGRKPFATTWQAMRDFTDSRTHDTVDELWVLEHESVYTLGQAGKEEHILNTANIPVVQTDRGGQVTWHGPGQVVVYTLVDLRRKNYGVRGMVERLEQAVIHTLASYEVEAEGRRDAPGVYVNNEKIAALGLRVRKGCAYHGLSMNIDSDMAPWLGINPCGFAGLGVTRLVDQISWKPAPVAETAPKFDSKEVVTRLLAALERELST